MSRFLRRLAPPLVGIVVFALLWEALVHVLGIRRFVLLPPSTVVETFGDDPGFYLRNALITGRHMVVGLSIALVLAIGAGAVMAASRFVEEAAQPVLVLILVTPWVAYITSVVLWLNGGEPTIVFMVAFTSFPVLTFGVVGGMKSADPAARELLASVDARPWEVLWRLRLPAAMPSIFTTLRFALGLGLAAAYFSEGSALTTDGLGAIGRRAASFNDAERLWTTIVSAALLGIVGLALITALERSLLRWHASQRRR
jgi:NitT/TauT family transport system permease protein